MPRKQYTASEAERHNANVSNKQKIIVMCNYNNCKTTMTKQSLSKHYNTHHSDSNGKYQILIAKNGSWTQGNAEKRERKSVKRKREISNFMSLFQRPQKKKQKMDSNSSDVSKNVEQQQDECKEFGKTKEIRSVEHLLDTYYNDGLRIREVDDKYVFKCIVCGFDLLHGRVKDWKTEKDRNTIKTNCKLHFRSRDCEEYLEHRRLRKHRTLQKDRHRGELALTNLFLILIESIIHNGSDNSWTGRVGNAYLQGVEVGNKLHSKNRLPDMKRTLLREV